MWYEPAFREGLKRRKCACAPETAETSGSFDGTKWFSHLAWPCAILELFEGLPPEKLHCARPRVRLAQLRERAGASFRARPETEMYISSFRVA